MNSPVSVSASAALNQQAPDITYPMTTIRKLRLKARLATNVIALTIFVGGAFFLIYSNREVSTVEAVRSREILTLFENSKEAFYNRRMMDSSNLGEAQNGSDHELITPTKIKEANQTMFTNPESIPQELVNRLDAIYILGGDNPLSPRDPSVSVQRAIEDVTSLLERGRKSALRTSHPLNTSVVCLSTGYPKISGLSVISQAAISASYLLRSTSANGTEMIDPDNVFIETNSMDIIGSAFYSRTQFADHNDWKNILIVTNQVSNWIAISFNFENSHLHILLDTPCTIT